MEKRINSRISFKLGLLFVVLLNVVGCKKEDTVVEVPPQAHFTGVTFDSYFITGPSVTKKIPIGLTSVSDKDRTVTFSVTSPTGAVAGTHYNIAGGNSIVIPAGEALDSITVAGVYSQYLSGRKDTLIFTLNGSDVAPSDYNASLKLLMRGPCFDGDVTLSDMAGNYTKTFENGSYGPYTTTISGITLTSATTGTATLTNVYDYFGPVTINFDWTNPNNTMVEIPLQITDQEYDVGQPFYVRTKPGASNKFSVCNQTFTFILDVLVDISGTLYYYDNGVVYTMAR